MLTPKDGYCLNGFEIYSFLDGKKIFKRGQILNNRKTTVRYNQMNDLCSGILTYFLNLVTDDLIDNGNTLVLSIRGGMYAEYRIDKNDNPDKNLLSTKFDNVDFFKIGEKITYSPKLIIKTKNKFRTYDVNVGYHRQRRINENVNNGMRY